MAKQFDPQLHKDNDPRGRAKAIEILSTVAKGKIIEESKSKYDIDLTIRNQDGSICCYVEVEVKNSGWYQKDSFPFAHDGIDIPYRKKKFFEGEGIRKYMLFNSGLTAYFLLDKSDIINCPVVRKDTWNEKNDLFYRVPYKPEFLKNKF